MGSHAGVLDERAQRAGWWKECHADLRAEHVILRPELSVVDCVEFALDLRTLDVADDLAFLVMDLAAHGAETVAARLVAAYRGTAAATVATMRWCRSLPCTGRWWDEDPTRPRRAASARQRARGDGAGEPNFMTVAERFGWRALEPLALVMCGGPATGKSYLAAAVGGQSGLPLLNSDVVRKELVSLGPHERAPV